ncbi:unnamed protein product [Ceratitis capitata]|uniref:(Mediterranean fruit fly) hypothetical protein n=1 Tax=Ceratitis capitata TaxID=7213 RepID=A0A811V6C5_CERCA|nr:unnamed protein product [Ceratitis capitata]
MVHVKHCENYKISGGTLFEVFEEAESCFSYIFWTFALFKVSKAVLDYNEISGAVQISELCFLLLHASPHRDQKSYCEELKEKKSRQQKKKIQKKETSTIPLRRMPSLVHTPTQDAENTYRNTTSSTLERANNKSQLACPPKRYRNCYS